MRKVKKKMRFKKIILLLLFLLLCILSVYYFFLGGEEKIKINIASSSVSKDYIVSLTGSLDKVYLAIGGTKEITVDIKKVGNPDTTLEWKSEDESIVSIEDGVLTGVSKGNTKVIISSKNNKSFTIDVVVTDLITVPTYNNNKTYLPCERYTYEEAELLDEILAARVKEAGEGTRGGAVAAARFLVLEFPYQVKYFNENGRLGEGSSQPYIDAEGRYYHKGLYLHSSKFSELIPGASTSSGPAIWGCTLYDNFLSQYRPNGFTCSGFITWVLYNGGLDVGDVGAGDYSWLDNELSDMGPHQEITYDFMKNGKYKVGDFIARDGHAAIIIGITDTMIYTAEALPPKVKIWEYERYSGIVKDPNLTYIINMDDIYPNGEGKYTDMW